MHTGCERRWCALPAGCMACAARVCHCLSVAQERRWQSAVAAYGQMLTQVAEWESKHKALQATLAVSSVRIEELERERRKNAADIASARTLHVCVWDWVRGSESAHIARTFVGRRGSEGRSSSGDG